MKHTRAFQATKFFPLLILALYAMGGTPAWAQPNPAAAARLDLALGQSPRGSALGDFDGDGFVDLAAVLELTSRLEVFPGHGDGTFGMMPPGDLSPIFSVLVPPGPMDVQAGHFDSGDNLDLVVVSCFASTISIFLGNGNGTFALSAEVGTSDDCPVQAVVADLDGDSQDDIAVAVNGSPPSGGPNAIQGILEFFPGDGAGLTERSTRITTGNIPHAVATADFNGDGSPDDLVVANFGDNTVSILLNDGAGNFTSLLDPDTGGPPDTGDGPVGVATGDLNHDSFTDVATVNKFDNTVTFLLNDLGGLSPFSGPFFLHGGGQQPQAIAIVNVNQDIEPLSENPLNDIVTANFASDNLSFFVNDNMTPVPMFQEILFRVGRGPTDITVSVESPTIDSLNMPEAGLPDLVVANLLSNNFSVLIQSPPGEAEVMFAADGVTLIWDEVARVPDAILFGKHNVTRGFVSNLIDTDFDGLSEDYGTCFMGGLSGLTLSIMDSDIPPLGDAHFYIVTGVNSFGEGTVGFASNTALRLGQSPCISP